GSHQRRAELVRPWPHRGPKQVRPCISMDPPGRFRHLSPTRVSAVREHESYSCKIASDQKTCSLAIIRTLRNPLLQVVQCPIVTTVSRPSSKRSRSAS